jgi:hypothetical protein
MVTLLAGSDVGNVESAGSHANAIETTGATVNVIALLLSRHGK